MSNGKEKKRQLARAIASRMPGAAPQIDAVRSPKGEIKGFFSQDTLYRLRQAVADHDKAATDTFAEARLAVILGLCDTYFERHGNDTDDRAIEKLNAVDRIQQQAMGEMRDWGQRQAQLRYVRDVQADVDDDGMEHISSGASVTAVMQATDLAKGKTHPNGKEGFNQATLDLIKHYGLTEAEVLAVKVYTADDYKYINPATNPSVPWNEGKLRARLEKNQPDGFLETNKGKEDLRSLLAEGSLHGAVAIEAVKKLPPSKGTLYRGMRLTEAEFQEQYGNLPVPDETLRQLTSLATEEGAARRFADGEGNTTNPLKTVSVMMYVEVETGRDIGDLSVFGHDEKEWLLLPGVVLVTDRVDVADKIEDSIDGHPGVPHATKWVRIMRHQQ
jgi:hypothetical protein